MWVEVIRTKIHRLTVTEANLNYVGSITLDEALLEAADLLPHEKVQVVNLNNGARFETYVIKGARGSGTVCLNGPAARLVLPGDVVIVIAYGLLPLDEARSHEPRLLFPTAENRLP